MTSFDINFLDHVALRVKDLEASALWYEKVLGLKRQDLPKLGAFPIILLAGNSGIALFPANTGHVELDQASRNVKIDHFAFNVTKPEFEKAKIHFDKLDIPYNIQDHIYNLSIYINDPDGHQVELTTPIN